MKKLHIDLVHIDNPEITFNGFVSAESQATFGRNFFNKIPFILTTLAGNKILVTEEMLKKCFVAILTEETSAKILENYKKSK